MRLLVVNVGSSSLKLSVLDDLQRVASDDLPTPDGTLDEAAIRHALSGHGPFDAVGHRIVHGGTEFTQAVVVDDQVRKQLEALVDLAPLHLPPSLAGLDLFRKLLPRVPAAACFDTAFHTSIPAPASTYALPAEWRRRWPLRRFGFHGLSHAYASRRAAELVSRPVGSLRIVTCHLGAGASLAAVDRGVSVDTTMGFTPLEGLVMATRSGTVDPGLVLWLERHVGMPAAELEATLERRSGLAGLAGTADMRAVLDAEGRGDEQASLAVGVYLHRLRASVAAMVAAMAGMDVLVFTGGVGERAPSLRARAARGLAFLGVDIDEEADRTARPDAEVTAKGAAVRTLVIEAREDLQMGQELERLFASG